MLFLPTFPSIKRQRIGSISFSNTHHIRLLLPKLTIWWGNTKMVYVPTTYQISPLSCHYYASSLYLWHIKYSFLLISTKPARVVIRFQICIFDILIQHHPASKDFIVGCDSLSNLYLWHIKYSRKVIFPSSPCVVIRFQVCIFDILNTAMANLFNPAYMLWFAFKFVSLTY